MDKKKFVSEYQKTLEWLSREKIYGRPRTVILDGLKANYILQAAKFQEGDIVYLNDNEFTNLFVRIGKPVVYLSGKIKYPMFNPKSGETVTISESRFNEQHIDEPHPDYNSLKGRAVKQRLSATYMHFYRAHKVGDEYLSKNPANQHIFVNPVETPKTEFVKFLISKLFLDQINSREIQEPIHLSKKIIEGIFTDTFRDLYFALEDHFVQGHKFAGDWQADNLKKLKGVELQILAKTLQIPHTGRKSMVATRIEKTARVLMALSGYSHEQKNVFGECDMCRYDKGVQHLSDDKLDAELNFLCKMAGVMTNTEKYTKALFLLKAKDQVALSIKKNHTEAQRHIPKFVRNILAGRTENLQKAILVKHPDLGLYQDTVATQKKYHDRLYQSLPDKDIELTKSTAVETSMPIFDHKTANYLDSLGKKDIKIIISLSGGKDSIATYLLAQASGVPIHSVVFADTGWEFPEVYDMLQQIEEQDDIRIIRLLPKESFDDQLKRYSWPHMKGRWCTRNKVGNISQYLNQIKEKESVMVECVGFAADEVNRALKMQDQGEKEWPAFPLIDAGMDEKAALTYAQEDGYFWGDAVSTGLYSKFDRVSCWCCPLKNQKELETLRSQFPEYWQRLLDMEKTIIGRPDQIIGFKGMKTVADLDREIAEAAGEIVNPEEIDISNTMSM
jgi:3'-phosphoadenosine 5'-phosphosulfate sulfotransferase (PAPS reductase)/FAD synthetase